MANVIEITDLEAPELAPFARLTEAQLRSRRAPDQGIFIAESAKVIACALDAGCVPLSFLVERRHMEGRGRALIDRCGGVPVYTAPRSVLAELTGYELTRGMLCALRRPTPRTAEEVCAGARRLAVLEGITDHANVGALFRSAAALGMDGVLLDPTCGDPLYRKAVRVSMGAVFQLPWARLEERYDHWPHRGLERLRALGFRTAAMALEENSLPLDHPRLQKEEKLAILLGSEGDGLRPETIHGCDYTLRIPMAHGVDSLNVAAAGAVAFWQLREDKGTAEK